MNDLQSIIEDLDEEAVVLTGLDNCVIGTVENHSMNRVLVYSVDRIIRKLMMRDDMSLTEAVEFFSFNIEGAHLGAYNPVYLYNEIKP